MALQAIDLSEYRHRRETMREQNLRLEVSALADSIAEFDRRTKPHRQRMFLVAQECGPMAMASWNAIEYGIGRLMAQADPETAA